MTYVTTQQIRKDKSTAPQTVTGPILIVRTPQRTSEGRIRETEFQR